MGRYERLFTLPANLYTEGAPLLVAAGALLKDGATGKVLAQLKFTNICDKAVKAVKVRITPFDTVGRPLGAAVPFTYLDLFAARDADFGQKTPVPLTGNEVRSFTVTVEEVAFADNTLWAPPAGAVWEPLPVPQPVQQVLKDPELVKQYTWKYGQNHTVWPLRTRDLWFCGCGALNHAAEEHCHRCIWTQENLDIDIEALRAEAAERMERERLAAAQAAERARLAAIQAAREQEEAWQRAAKRKKRIALAALAVVITGILVWAFLRYAWPRIRTELDYREAQAALEAGEYGQARTGFEALADYKDSPALLQEAVYQQAESLLEAGEYEKAKMNYTDLGDYKDAAEKIKEADYRLAGAKLAAGDFAAAQKLYKGLKKYKDAADQLKEAYYQEAVQAMKAGDYEAAMPVFENYKTYKDCDQRLQEASYAYGCELLKRNKYYEATVQLQKCPDKEDASQKLLEAEYGYTSTHREYDNPTTYYFAKNLVEQGYPGAQDLYNEIFALHVKIVISDSESFPPTAKTYISRYSKVNCFVQLQGEPRKEASFYAVGTLPGYSPSRTESTEKSTVGDWRCFTFWFTNPAYGSLGTFTVKIYDSATGKLLGESSVQIT